MHNIIICKFEYKNIEERSAYKDIINDRNITLGKYLEILSDIKRIEESLNHQQIPPPPTIQQQTQQLISQAQQQIQSQPQSQLQQILQTQQMNPMVPIIQPPPKEKGIVLLQPNITSNSSLNRSYTPPSTKSPNSEMTLSRSLPSEDIPLPGEDPEKITENKTDNIPENKTENITKNIFIEIYNEKQIEEELKKVDLSKTIRPKDINNV